MIPHAAESPQPGQPTHRRTAGPTQSCSVPTRNRRRRTRSLALPGPPSPTPPSSRHQTPVQVIRSGSCKSYGKSRLSEISIHPHVPCAAGERSTSRSRGTWRRLDQLHPYNSTLLLLPLRRRRPLPQSPDDNPDPSESVPPIPSSSPGGPARPDPSPPESPALPPDSSAPLSPLPPLPPSAGADRGLECRRRGRLG